MKLVQKEISDIVLKKKKASPDISILQYFTFSPEMIRLLFETKKVSKK